MAGPIGVQVVQVSTWTPALAMQSMRCLHRLLTSFPSLLWQSQKHHRHTRRDRGESKITNEICAENEHESLVAEVFDETDQWRANARLIAAAPDLLSRLKSLVEDLKGAKELMLSGTESDSWMITEDGWDVLIENSEAIIRKAEGEA